MTSLPDTPRRGAAPGAGYAGIEPFAVDAAGAAHLCGVGRSFWMQLHAAGQVPAPIHLGRRVLWRVDELRAWVEAGCPSAEDWRDRPHIDSPDQHRLPSRN